MRSFPKPGGESTVAQRFPGGSEVLVGFLGPDGNEICGKASFRSRLRNTILFLIYPKHCIFVSNFRGSYQPLIVRGSPQVKVKMPCSSIYEIAVLKAC